MDCVDCIRELWPLLDWCVTCVHCACVNVWTVNLVCVCVCGCDFVLTIEYWLLCNVCGFFLFVILWLCAQDRFRTFSVFVTSQFFFFWLSFNYKEIKWNQDSQTWVLNCDSKLSGTRAVRREYWIVIVNLLFVRVVFGSHYFVTSEYFVISNV